MNKTAQIRELAKQVADIAHSDDNLRKREMWRKYNAFDWDGPIPVLLSVDGFCFKEILAPYPMARDPVYGAVETQLRKQLWYASLGSDMVIEPWVMLGATYHESSATFWGIQMHDSWVGDNTVFHGEFETPEDIERMQVPAPHLDGTTTLEQYDRTRELLDGILDVRVEWRHRHLCIAKFGAWAFQLMGQRRMLEWFALYPDLIKRFFQITADGFVRHNQGLERRRRLTDNNCFIPDFYAWHGTRVETPRLCDMWVHGDGEEFSCVSPEMLEEYLFPVLRPIYALFGNGSYGCCESQDGKLGIVKTLPNLREVIISERCNWDYVIDELGTDYLLAVRPSLVDTVYAQTDDEIHAALTKMARTFAGKHWHLNFPGPLSLNGDPQRYHRFVETARDAVAI